MLPNLKVYFIPIYFTWFPSFSASCDKITWFFLIYFNVLSFIGEDELCVVQLSTFGDVYVEHFKFNIAPSILDKPLPLWYDRQTHNDESIVLKRIPFFPEPEKKDYALHSVVPILNRLLIQSYDWYKPKDVDEFIVQSGLSQYAPPQANPLSFEQLPSIFAKIKHQLDLMKMLENPISL